MHRRYEYRRKPHKIPHLEAATAQIRTTQQQQQASLSGLSVVDIIRVVRNEVPEGPSFLLLQQRRSHCFPPRAVTHYPVRASYDEAVVSVFQSWSFCGSERFLMGSRAYCARCGFDRSDPKPSRDVCIRRDEFVVLYMASTVRRTASQLPDFGRTLHYGVTQSVR